jgi:hypothetical protein
VEEHRVVDEDRVLPRPEPGEAMGDEVLERGVRLLRCGRPGPRRVVAPELDAERVEVGADLVVDGVLGRAPRVGRGRGGRPRAAGGSRGRGSSARPRARPLVEQQAEAAALVAVEGLHHEAPPVGPAGELVGLHEELVGRDDPHPVALEQPLGARAVGVRAHDVVEALQALGQRRHPAPLDDLDPLLAQLGGEPAHGRHDEVHPLAVRAHPGEASDRLDEEHARCPVERRVVAHELVAEDERGVVAHPADTAR